ASRMATSAGAGCACVAKESDALRALTTGRGAFFGRAFFTRFFAGDVAGVALRVVFVESSPNAASPLDRATSATRHATAELRMRTAGRIPHRLTSISMWDTTML